MLATDISCEWLKLIKYFLGTAHVFIPSFMFLQLKRDLKEGCKWLTVNTFIVEPEIDCWGFEIFSANNLKTTMWNKFSILIQMRYTQVYLSNIKPVSI